MGAAVIFTDRSLLSAATWVDLEKKLRQDKWNPGRKIEYREEMVRRAWIWSHTAIQEEGPAKRFFQELERAGMLRIVKED